MTTTTPPQQPMPPNYTQIKQVREKQELRQKYFLIILPPYACFRTARQDQFLEFEQSRS